MLDSIKCAECREDRKAINELQKKIYLHHAVENKKLQRGIIIAYTVFLFFLAACGIYMGVMFNK